MRCQCVGPTIPDSPDAVMRDDADQASLAVLSMMPGDGDRALNLIGRQRGLLDPAMLMIAVSAASRAPSRCTHPSAGAYPRPYRTHG